ncbi:MAG: hypothetical protein VXW73_01970 [Actinomycetota bacterium]|nr:hypothetical protein [Actinomycetota bacterium]
MFHLRDQVRAGEGFDLHISDRAAIWQNCSESKVDAAVPGAEAEMADGITHMNTPAPRMQH